MYRGRASIDLVDLVDLDLGPPMDPSKPFEAAIMLAMTAKFRYVLVNMFQYRSLDQLMTPQHAH